MASFYYNTKNNPTHLLQQIEDDHQEDEGASSLFGGGPMVRMKRKEDASLEAGELGGLSLSEDVPRGGRVLGWRYDDAGST